MVNEDLLIRFKKMSREILGDNLIGIYLHGSSVMGCFNAQKSDLDLILVVENEIPDAAKLELMRNVVKLNEEAPAKGLELSIVKKAYCDPFVYPTPYELHFSCTHLNWFREKPEDYVEKMKGIDKDLAAHFMIIRRYGVVIYGAGIEEVFGEVPAKDYIDSIWFDVENACEDIVENPLYVTLNLCRVLAYLQEGLVLSKQAGGEWGMRTLQGEFLSLIETALECYKTDREMTVDKELARDFAGQMLVRIEEHLERMYVRGEMR